MLKQQIKNELKDSMLAKQELKTSVLRMLLSAITYYEIQKGGAGYEANDEDVLIVIESQVKQRKDSIEQYKNANRPELAEKEQKEMEMLLIYLPEQMSEDEIKKIVENTIKQTGAKTPSDLGKVMSVIIPQTKGKADGSLISKIVREQLSE